MSNNDHALEMILSKILKFNKEISTNQKNKGLKIQKKIKNCKKTSTTTTVVKIMDDEKDPTGGALGSSAPRRAALGRAHTIAIKKIEDDLIKSSVKFLLQKLKKKDTF